MSSSEPIRLHPQNPHYYLFEGQPAILITSAEHYGAVVNGDFDYVAYLDALASYGLNYTRIYPGYLFEPQDKFIRDNTLGPRPESLVLPWARSHMPGYVLGGNKFDLNTWNEAFFARLADFVAQAAQRHIVVEICFFNCQYADTWPLSPLYHQNNIQGIGTCDHNGAQTLQEHALALVEERYVRRIVEEVNRFDNIILEICDEPILLGTPPEQAGAWISHMAEAILATERDLPKKHLIAQQVEGSLDGPCDFSGDPRISVIVGQYVWEAGGEQEGGIKALECEYAHDKPIELNETNYYPVWYQEDRVASSRVEAWEFIVGGGASFNHLNGLYTVPNPAGHTPDNEQICSALRNLAAFMHSVQFVRMRPDRSWAIVGKPGGVSCRGMSEPGRHYAFYIHHGRLDKPSVYTVTPGAHKEEIEIPIPAGRYWVDWIDPASGTTLGDEMIEHHGGPRTFTTPVHAVDIALRIRRILG